MRKLGKIAYFTLSLGYFAAALGYAAYAAYSGTGPYRLMTEWQREVYGIYSGPLSFVILLAALTALGAALIGGLARILIPTERKTAMAARSAPRIARPHDRPSPGAAVLRRVAAAPLAAAAIGLALLAGGVGTGYVSAARSRQEPPLQDVDLGEQQAPKGDFVRVKGFAHTDLAVERKTRRRLVTIAETYIPITGRDWRRDQPVAYVLKVTEQQYWLPIISKARPPFSAGARPAVVVLAATTDRDGLPSRVAQAFGEDHLLLAENLVVLDLELHPYLQSAREAALIATVVGLFLLVFGLLFRAAFRHNRTEGAPEIGGFGQPIP